MMSDNEVKYKDTSIGKIPIDWDIKRLGELVNIISGSSPTEFKLSSLGKFPYLKVEDLNNNSKYQYLSREYTEDKNRNLVYAESLIFPKRGAAIMNNKIRISKKDCYLDSNLMAINPKNTAIINLEFLYYKILKIQLFKIADTSTIPQLNNKHILPFKISLPPLSEQQKIAEILSTWDKAIQEANNIIKALEKRNKILAFSLLTGKKRLKEFVQTPLKKVMIKEIAKEIALKNKSDEDYTVFSCTKYNGLVPSLEYFGKKIYSDNLTTYKVIKKNQFAYATNHIEEGSIGILKNVQVGLISPMYTVFEFGDEINLNYAYSLLKTDFYINEYKRRMEGSIDRRGGLRWTEFSKIFINLPSLEEQNKIADVLNKSNEELKQYKLKLENIKQQKKGLMQQLLTGKVRTI